MDGLTRASPPTERAPVRPKNRARTIVSVLLCAAAIAGIVYIVWFWPKREDAGRTAARTPPVPVVVAPATQKDVPIYLDALGTVQAYNTVTVKPMVDGPLTSVNFKEGQAVKAGDVLATIDSRTYKAAYDQAVAKKQQDEAQLANARLDLIRYQKLAANAYTSAQLADTAKATVAQDEALVAQDQAQIDNARTQLSYTTITSPIDGLTGIRQVDVGNIVHASDATGLVVLTQMHPISVVFTLPQQTLPAVAKAMRDGAPEVLAYPQGAASSPRGLLDKGTLSVLDNQVDQSTGTIKLKATFPNPDNTLWPGGFVGVRLRVDVAKDAVVVPSAAIQRGPRGSYVYVVRPDDTVARRQVSVGHEDENGSIITEGLKAGDSVVIDGASRLTDGAQVTVVPPVAAASAGAAGTMRTSAPGAADQQRHRRPNG
ncbi:MAG: efflux RND transporter periplasmic adaptor subunit [Proteobacteria bacterium]|nr:efflux RND transporter periplasmic adaptor subunit [Pseudomonadota bacterium]